MAYLQPTSASAREIRTVAGNPVAGTDEVQTVTFGGTPDGGTFKFTYKGQTTAPIAWSATNNTLRDNVDAALGALSTVGGASNVTTAVGTMTAGVGTLTVTFVANLGKLDVPLITVHSNAMTGTAPTVANVTSTPGVTATHRGAPAGALVTDTTNGVWYQNTGTTVAPTWTAVDVAAVAGETTALIGAIPTAAVAAVAGLGIVISAADPTAVGAADPTAVSAADAVAVAGTTPSGGTGATQGAYDTSVNRDAFIATVAEMKTTVNALATLTAELKVKAGVERTELIELKAKAGVERTELIEIKADVTTISDTAVETKARLNELLAALRTAGIVTP